MNETILPKLAKHLKVKDGGYYDLLTALLERLAERQGISPFRVRTEEAFLKELAKKNKTEIKKRKERLFAPKGAEGLFYTENNGKHRKYSKKRKEKRITFLQRKRTGKHTNKYFCI